MCRRTRQLSALNGHRKIARPESIRGTTPPKILPLTAKPREIASGDLPCRSFLAEEGATSNLICGLFGLLGSWKEQR